MNAVKVIAYIAAAILIFFGVLFIWGSGSPQGGGFGWIAVGFVSVVIGFGLIYLASRKPKSDTTNVTVQIDLPGKVQFDTMKCKSCGGSLSTENITLVAGAPVVTCPFCKSSYSLTEEPKW
jgi:Na+/melibiose symporter-like transporter